MDELEAKLDELRDKAAANRAKQAEENRRKFPILSDPFVAELCDYFNGRVIAVANNNGEIQRAGQRTGRN